MILFVNASVTVGKTNLCDLTTPWSTFHQVQAHKQLGQISGIVMVTTLTFWLRLDYNRGWFKETNIDCRQETGNTRSNVLLTHLSIHTSSCCCSTTRSPDFCLCSRSTTVMMATRGFCHLYINTFRVSGICCNNCGAVEDTHCFLFKPEHWKLFTCVSAAERQSFYCVCTKIKHFVVFFQFLVIVPSLSDALLIHTAVYQ